MKFYVTLTGFINCEIHIRLQVHNVCEWIMNGYNTDMYFYTLNHPICLIYILIIDIEYNKRLDRQRPCLEGDLTAGSNL